MSVVGLIAEYNPFHNGHMYHLLESKKITNSKYSIAVMSGNFLQRGEPALLDKWTRAKMAIDSGVDLVLELPFVFASQSAEYFSEGAVKLLDHLNIVDSICFGSEVGDTSLLGDIAEVLVDEPLLFKSHLKNYLNIGLSFPKSRSLALTDYFSSINHKKASDIGSIVSSPNNILGIEYMKSLRKLNSSIDAFTIKRTSSEYHDIDIKPNISSATSIREDYFKNKNLNNTRGVVPSDSYRHMNDFLQKYNTFNNLGYFSDILFYIFRVISYDKISYVNGVDEGLENRIHRAFNNFNDLNLVLGEISTKRYTLTRIKRILISTLMELDKDLFEKLYTVGPRYIRVLGVSRNGIDLLSSIKAKSNLPIITKFSGYEKSSDEYLKKMIALDKKATDIYFTGLSKFTASSSMNLDHITTPYFSKK